MKKLIINNLETLLQTLKEQANKSIFLLFTGSKDSSGKSWCPDCNTADPVIEQVINEQTYDSDDYLFITVFVGERDVWKNPQNSYRNHTDFKIKSVPTLINWQNSLRLEESQCADKELVKMLIDEN